MGLQDKMVSMIVEEAWSKVKNAVGDGGRELLKNPWPIIDTFRFIAEQLERYALSHNIPRQEGKKNGS